MFHGQLCPDILVSGRCIVVTSVYAGIWGMLMSGNTAMDMAEDNFAVCLCGVDISS